MGIFNDIGVGLEIVRKQALKQSERTLGNKTVVTNVPSDDVDFDPPHAEPEYWWERAERDSGMTAKDFK